MTSKIAPSSVCKIIAPAHPSARGRVVTVLRLATGDPDLDGAVFAPSSAACPIWVVKALHAPIPWGLGSAKVFAIEEECLALHFNPVEDMADSQSIQQLEAALA